MKHVTFLKLICKNFELNFFSSDVAPTLCKEHLLIIFHS